LLLKARPALGLILQAGVADDTSPDVHDRALLYYRLLKTDINEVPPTLELSIYRTQAARVVGGTGVPIRSFVEHTGSLEISAS
jgi:hypothetical protein